jgi:DNA-binding NtrC family response regulator
MEKSLNWEFKVVPISSLSEFERVIDGEENIDAVVVDVNFESAESEASRYAGLRLAEAVRTKRADLPIIMTSAFMESLDHEISSRALHETGVDVFVNKSYAGTPDVMGASLREAIRKAAKRRARPGVPVENKFIMPTFGAC